MKIVNTKGYKKAQQVYNPDIGEFEDFSAENYDIIDREPIEIKPDTEGDLPILTPEDLGKRIPLADNVEEEPIDEQDIEPIEADQEDYPEFPSTMQAMQYAVENKETVRIYYVCKGGTYLIRDVEPHGWFKAKTTNNMILVTWDQDVGWYRAFIISPNIQRYEWKGEQFNSRFNFKAERTRFLGRLRQNKYRRRKQREKNIKEL